MSQPQQPSGDEREDQAAIAGAEAAAVMAAATAAVLAAMVAIIVSVASGTLGWQMAKRKARRMIAVTLGTASGKMRKVYADAAKRADPGGHATLPIPGLPGEPGKRGVLPGAPAQIARAVLAAQQDAGEAFDAAMYAALGGKGAPLPPPGSPYRDAVEKAMRRLTGIGEDVKDLTGAERVAQSLSRLQAAQAVMNDLASRGITGFTDSAGRRWSLDAYAEMATRTAASRMHLSAQLSLMGQHGFDLAIVDNPAMTASCPRCRPWEGQVISLAGSGTGSSTITDASGVQRTAVIKGTLAEAVASGLFHPACRHSLTVWADGHGAVATAGGQERGYVEQGQPTSRPLPIGTPQQYKDEQKLRGHERNVRRASLRVAAAVDPKAKAKAKAHLAHARAGLEAHVTATGVTRLPGREKAGRAR